jgi:hypothetical protein
LNITNQTVVTASTTQITISNPATGTGTGLGSAYLFSSGLGLTVNGNANVSVLNSASANVVGTITAGNLSLGTGNATGNVFTATTFSGNGSGITYIAASAVTGKVTSATSADTAGTASSASKLTTAVTINGVSFDGSASSYTLTANATTLTGTSLPSGITSATGLTSVGTLNSLTVSGAFSGSNLTSSGYIFSSVAGGVTASSSNPALSQSVNVISSGSGGVTLPAAAVGMSIIIINLLGSSINVFPYSGAQIDSKGTNTAFLLGPNARLQFIATGLSQWYSMLAVYG